MHYFPLAWPFLAGLFFILLIVVALIELHVLTHVYQQIGIPPRYVMAVLIGTLLGSAINVPVGMLAPEKMVTEQVVSVFGVRYIVPAVEEWPATILAVNVGGALIPVAVSVYLVVKNRLYLRTILSVSIVAIIVYQLATPVRGIGISVPTLVPPLVAAATAIVLDRRKAPSLAYVAGSLGTLIGADLLNLGRIHGLGAPVASIGGAGTFDGIFLTGILAVLLSPVAEMDSADRSPT